MLLHKNSYPVYSILDNGREQYMGEVYAINFAYACVYCNVTLCRDYPHIVKDRYLAS